MRTSCVDCGIDIPEVYNKCFTCQKKEDEENEKGIEGKDEEN